MADLLDLLSLDEARTAINSSSVSVTGLEQMITAVSRIVDETCGPVVVRTVTAELHDGGCQAIYLRRRPVTSITTVREVQTPGTIDTLAAVAWGASGDGYFALAWDRDPTLRSGVIERRLAGVTAPFYGTSQAVEVTYIAGRYATTAAVDERFKAAAAAVLRRLWKRESGAWSQSPTFLENADLDSGQGFYRAVKPIVEELLADEIQLADAGLA